MDERRRTPRRRVLKGGTIEFNRAGGVSCTVRSLSPAGACLEVVSPVGIPCSFDLVIGGDSHAHHCKVIWQSADRIGVEFT